MRETKVFGKRRNNKVLPNNKVLKDTFGVVNNGEDSNQVVRFIRATTGRNISENEVTIGNIHYPEKSFNEEIKKNL